MMNGARVWDLPTRLFHWLLVLTIACAWWSAENHAMDWHYRFGLTALGLIVFRVIWGVIGGSTARFASFVRGPGAVASYLRGDQTGPKPGHNPLGGYSVLLMLVLLAAQVGSGLFATDIDGLESGPLSFLVEFDTGRGLAELHELSFNLLLAVILFHVLAILWYRLLRKRNLITPMFSGRDRALDPVNGELRSAGPVRFVAALVVAGAIVWAFANGLWL